MKTIRVEQVYRLHGTATDSIPEDTSLEYVIGRFARESGLRGVFLVDSRQRLSGVLTRTDLMKWAHLQLFGGKGRHEIAISDFFRIIDAKKAKDLVTTDPRVISVKESDNLQNALDKMLDHEEDVLPVVDDERRILGDLRLSEVLLKVLEAGKVSGSE
ncbi:MAG TPA: CBS domain-containing protein [Dehalococcoidia bacterium]|nr:CBS domain-containing protein [Dehalococcoidia bacterium]